MSDPFDLTDTPNSRSGPQPAAPAAEDAPYLQGLNEAQREAVLTLDGPVLVLAGAGTGKTRVLTTRLTHLIATGRAWPSQLLAVTFTNKAAREMHDRVAHMIGSRVEGMPWLGTFHAIANKILRRHAELVGLRSNFTILDTDDQLRLVKQILSAENIDDKRWPARLFAGCLDRWKNRALTPDKLPESESFLFAEGKGKYLYKVYQERLQTLNAADFGDLLLHNITLFQDHPDVLADFQKRFKYILVDEYQDTNVAQYLWLRLLAQKNAQGLHNICCVGDDDQSIYGWRGAEVGNILRFESDFPGAKIIRLERNYRSTPHILGAASGLIASNEGRLGKTLWTDLDEGEKVHVIGCWDDDEEARIVAENMDDQCRAGFGHDQMAVLVRAGFQTRVFEERLMTEGIPYRVIGGPKFYERMEIRDAMAYLRVVYQPDDDLAFERIINTPRRGLGNKAQAQIHQLARQKNLSLTAAVQLLVQSDEMTPRARTALSDLLQQFQRWRGLLDSMSHIEVAEIILDESGYTAMWQNDKSADAPGRLDNLTELIRAMEPFESLQAFLEHVALATIGDEDMDTGMVSLMTLHAAKGLEFDVVYLPGWEEGLFPHQRALDEGGLTALEEERRLAYVGLTRAKQKATILSAANRRIYNQWQSSLPSRFLDELPEEHVIREAAPGLYAGGSRYGASEPFNTWPEQGRAAPNPYRSPRRKIIDASANRIVDVTPVASDYAIGERVFHDKFGYGLIVDVDGNKLEIDFDKAGTKRVIDSFIRSANEV